MKEEHWNYQRQRVLKGGSICVRSTAVKGLACTVSVRVGQSFPPKTAFAGYDDFPAYLASVSVEDMAFAPHER